MNKASVKKEALERLPKVAVEFAEGLTRHDIVKLLPGNNNVGIELGVAEGSFSSSLVRSGKFGQLFGADVYGDIHDTAEYKNAILNIGIGRPYKLLRLTFEDALELFPDDYFDFIYIDGFAHTGEEGGRTLVDWYPKLKVGGIMAGDDYHENWPLVMWAVNHFVSQLGAALTVTEIAGGDKYSMFPSWFITKQTATAAGALSLDERLVQVSESERLRIHRMRTSRVRALRRQVFGVLRRILRGPVSRHPGHP
ncbi:class I SAM-dependent methyltransferase [Frateuria sp. YIM B11624]|uniref:class I SAM-dependent methyltransferase n=1 Tax=Frateuria sp. YIM B11624 TaxID=3143185 RepID=UPI003C70A8C6